MDPTALTAFLPPKYQPLAASLLGLAGCLFLLLHSLDALVQGLLTALPGAAWLKSTDRVLHALLAWWPHRLRGAPSQPPPAGTIAGAVQPPPRGFASLPVLALLSALAVGWPGLLVLVTGAWAVYAVAYLALSIRRSASRADPASYWIRRSERGVIPVVVLIVVGIIVLLGGGTTALVIAEHKGPVVLNCAEAKLSAGAAGIEGQVATVLAGGGDWEGALLALGAKVGTDVVACAVTAILTPLDGGTHAYVAPQVRANGEAWLTSHGYAVPR